MESKRHRVVARPQKDGGWVLPTRSAFSRFITTTLLADDTRVTSAAEAKAEGMRLFSHQAAVRDFIQYDSPYRGCLLYHGVGVGKTCSSIAAFEASMAGTMGIVIMTPASLKGNYIQEIRKCGNGLFSQAQRWTLVLAGSPDFVSRCEGLHLNPRSVRSRAQGVWVPGVGTGSTAHADLTEEQRHQVAQQIDLMIQGAYQFIHYNGIPVSTLDAWLQQKPNPLSNKAIVVDEVHKLVSMAVGSGARGKKIYQLLVQAEGAKVIALSATPLINKPVELAWLVGMLKGHDQIFKAVCASPPSIPVVESVLLSDREVDRYETRGKVASFTRLPPGFAWVDDAATLVRRTAAGVATTSDEALSNRVKGALHAAGVDVTHVVADPQDLVPPLPLDEQVFDELFIDEKELTLRHRSTLAGRMLGCISYFSSYDPLVYPKRNPTQVVVVEMSDAQFQAYESVRGKERELESRANKMAALRKQSSASVFSDTTNVYRAFSRAVCNFAFPTDINRPWPSSSIVKDIIDDDDGVESPTKNAAAAAVVQTYDQLLESVLEKLKQRAATLFTGQRLQELSPKFASIIQRIGESPGPALVYSQFRTVEGLGLLAIAFEANGYAEFVLDRKADDWVVRMDPKDWKKPKFILLTGDPDRNKILLSVFNSQFDALPPRVRSALTDLDTSGKDEKNIHGSYVKALMITAAGAEGLSLQAVRQVHIVEPFWNHVRTEQVIGRAVRAHSHTDLPAAERQVDVYLYCVRFSEKQLAENITINKQDKGLTSDQAILDISSRKAKILDRVLELMQSAAFDCQIHLAEHRKDRPNAKCFESAATSITFDVAHNAQSEDDTGERGSGLRLIEYKGGQYAYDVATGRVFDMRSYELGKRVQVGVVTNGKLRLS